MILSGMTPRLPSVAESSVRLFPLIERFWSNGATEKACIIYRVKETDRFLFVEKSQYLFYNKTSTKQVRVGAVFFTCIFSSFSVWLAETMSAFSPLSFLCLVLLLIPPSLVVFVTGTAAADVALLSLNFCRFAPSSVWNTVMWIHTDKRGNNIHRHIDAIFQVHCLILQLS